MEPKGRQGCKLSLTEFGSRGREQVRTPAGKGIDLACQEEVLLSVFLTVLMLWVLIHI